MNNTLSQQVSHEIVERLRQITSPTQTDVTRLKIEVCKKYHAPVIPANSELLRILPDNLSTKYRPLLTTKQVRSMSGVTTVAVMPKPWACPHGKCTYCPGGPDIGVPRAYTGKEPAVMRALESDYDPYLQVSTRLAQLKDMGHIVDKVELILVGGTFPFMPRQYQEEFVHHCLDAVNGSQSDSLTDAKAIAETAPVKNVGITIETRPDWSRREHVDHMLSLGVTRVEIGVQTLYDDVYNTIHRDHTVKDVIEATRTLKDACLKVGYHMMLGLPGCDPARDLHAFRQIFEDNRFRPDMIKIYPCLVTPGTKLYEDWKNGTYKPYSTEDAAKLIAEIKQYVPRWVRIMRIQREIPSDGIADGVKHGNLRQLVEQELRERGVKCHCIRCREIGQRFLKKELTGEPTQIRLLRSNYMASQGEEIFLSFEDESSDTLVGYVRLRIPSSEIHRSEIDSVHTALVRELHVFGQTVPVGSRMLNAYQHKGYGGILLREAEKIAFEEYDRSKMIVISALGTKQYYSRFGYMADGPYVSKQLQTYNN